MASKSRASSCTITTDSTGGKVDMSNKGGWKTPASIRKTLPRSPTGHTCQLESANYFSGSAEKS